MLVTNICSHEHHDTDQSAGRERTRARLLAAALDLFARQGYERTTVAQIAAAAGVTEMTFYRHFGSKESAGASTTRTTR